MYQATQKRCSLEFTEYWSGPAVDRIKRRTRAAYRLKFGASIEPVFDRYLELDLRSRSVTLGFREAFEGPLFLEQYLERPIEQVLAALVRRPVDRSHVLELGHLVTPDERAVRTLMTVLSTWVDQREAHFVVIVLTRSLAALLSGLAIRLLTLAPAIPGKLPDPECWGSYFRLQPAVYAVDLVKRREVHQ